MSNATDEQYIEENEERLKRMKRAIEKGRRIEESNLRQLGGPRKTLSRRVALLRAFTGKERSQISMIPFKTGPTPKDLFSIAALGEGYERSKVINALSNFDDPAPSIEEAKKRVGLSPVAVEKMRLGLAAFMDRDWMSASSQTLEHFVKLVAEWDHKLASALLGAARIAIKSWEEL